MSNLHLTRAKHLLKQARTLRSQVQQNIRAHNFPDDDLHMRTYNDLIMAASELFFDDPILNGQMVKMPDAVVQMYSPEYGGWLPLGTMPLELPSQRTGQHLTRLINRLELLLGEESAQQPLDERDFSFVTDQKLRGVLILDFIEAQKAFNAEAYKAYGLLCGGLIEGMLLDIIQRPSVATEQQLGEVAKKLNLPRSGKSIDWDKVSMTNLIKMSNELGSVSKPVLKFAEGARDIRDTVHPRAEVRQEHRVLGDEAEILLQLVKLIYNDLVARFGEGKKND